MKQNLITVFLIGVLLFSSSFGLVLAAKVECPTCEGAGEVDCSKCDGTGFVGEAEVVECTRCGGTGQVKPNIVMRTMTAQSSGSTTDVTAVFENKEDFEVTATITVSLDGHSITSEETSFPPGEEVTIELSIPFTSYYTGSTLMTHIEKTINAEEVTCSVCNGQGTTEQGTVCSKCDGAGTITCPDCGGSGYVTEGAVLNTTKNSSVDWGFIGTVAAAVVVVVVVGVLGIFLQRKRRVNENSLRRLSSSDFQQWVLRRLDGKPSTSKDIAMGIDGFSRLNLPISIKQSDSVGMNAIDLFAASLAKNRASGGIMVAFGFGDDAIRGKVRARTNYRLNIQMMTVRELIEGGTASSY